MKGVVFTELLEMVESGYGFDTVDELLDLPGLTDDGAYTSVGTYEFQEMARLVSRLSTLLDVPVNDLLRDYGTHLFARFVSLFPLIFAEEESWQSLLTCVHDRIHVDVRKLYPEAELPSFTCRVEGDVVVMVYESTRPLASFAEGLILGCLQYFGEQRDVQCVLMGDEDGRQAEFRIR